MGYRSRAGVLLVCTALAQGVLQSGCATKLDFDKVSAGNHSADAALRDAGSAAATDGGSASDSASGRGEATAKADAASVFDAGPPVVSEATPPEAGRPDSHDGSDAAVLDGSLALEPSTFSCANVLPVPYFCDDFEGLPLSKNWDDVGVTPTTPVLGGTIEIDNSASRAGHASLLAQVNEGVSNCAETCLGLSVGLWLPDFQDPTKVVADFDVRVEQIDPTAKRRIVLFQLQMGTYEAGFTQQTLQIESHGLSVRAGLVEYNTAGAVPGSTAAPAFTVIDHLFQPTAALAQWVHVTYELDADDPNGTANHVKLTVDGVVLFESSPAYALRNAHVLMQLGVPWVDMTGFAADDKSVGWRVRYDNVLVRTELR